MMPKYIGYGKNTSYTRSEALDKVYLLGDWVYIDSSRYLHRHLFPIENISQYFVSNKAEGRISKRVFQENKECQIFQKRNISYRLICTHIKSKAQGNCIGEAKKCMEW